MSIKLCMCCDGGYDFEKPEPGSSVPGWADDSRRCRLCKFLVCENCMYPELKVCNHCLETRIETLKD